ncbi:hypothetical protein K435DRAFT_964704 [Dendrothele bispora CBS 962.96]|uniref:Uncharacterized protein n=1 Tax=Dendrothele bispora (strain CBS 962.96) TaxID=1314807 RepID=A0A4S8MAG8_DENBC|nr:hypothetical protein K435DRAFT_964704 [Dendrothele bispora CBS 962.96]
MSLAESQAPTTSASYLKTAHPRVKICDRRYGGFPISKDVALEWANRIRAGQPGQRPLTADPCESGNILLTLDEVVVEAGGVKCNFHGPRTPHGYEEYIIVTTEEWGGTFVKVNGVVEPGHELVEGRAETVGKELLKREGIEHGPFTTVFLSV